jgi:hypothetical protein
MNSVALHLLLVIALLGGPVSGLQAAFTCRVVEEARPDCCCKNEMRACASAKSERCGCCEVEVADSSGREGDASGAPLSDAQRFERMPIGQPTAGDWHWLAPDLFRAPVVPRESLRAASAPRLHLLHSVLRC